ncbi:hypothetical protein ZIOFF_056675 [Zingiber officinale]|uniref:Uncharacterized protein n=1 Tax=Zingiber officinale TaxID=94328 RepID=A0A8J5KFH3_ZINOF|nr:hypothetical protein ZIOFF_056675 [Zingiber officinale]
MAIAAVLDPTKKMLAVEFCVPKLYSELDASKHISKVKEIINSLYEEYVVEETNKGAPHLSESESFGSSSARRSQQSSMYNWDDFDDYCAKVEISETKRFELVDYLEKGHLKKNEIPKKFSCLEWWRMNRMQYPILSKIVADILAIVMSSVASEATFSAWTRVIDSYHSSLSSDTVQTLLGCKFSAEEERVVIELQAQLGNKWARIATYLPGRTDNDVKNFWSTRQKRLARILRTPLPPKSASTAKSTATLTTTAATTSSQGKQSLLQPPPPPPQDQYASASQILMQDPCSDHLHLFDGVEDDSGYRCMVIDLPPMPDPLSCCPSMLEFDAPPPLLAAGPEPCSLFLAASSQPDLDHHLLPQPLLGLPPDLALYQCQDPHFCDQLLPEELPFFGVKRSEQETALPPDNFFFDDLPPDMFDFIDRPPPPPPPPPTTKSC